MAAKQVRTPRTHHGMRASLRTIKRHAMASRRDLHLQFEAERASLRGETLGEAIARLLGNSWRKFWQRFSRKAHAHETARVFSGLGTALEAVEAEHAVAEVEKEMAQ